MLELGQITAGQTWPVRNFGIGRYNENRDQFLGKNTTNYYSTCLLAVSGQLPGDGTAWLYFPRCNPVLLKKIKQHLRISQVSKSSNVVMAIQCYKVVESFKQVLCANSNCCKIIRFAAN
jgi:hypothetical protein